MPNAITGQLCVVGLGPGHADLLTEQVKKSIAEATDAFGYFPYVERLSGLAHLRLHASDNREELERAGMTFSGTSPDGSLVEIAELSEQDWYVGCQFHPEFKSRPDRPHPLFTGFVAAALRKAGK